MLNSSDIFTTLMVKGQRVKNGNNGYIVEISEELVEVKALNSSSFLILNVRVVLRPPSDTREFSLQSVGITGVLSLS